MKIQSSKKKGMVEPLLLQARPSSVAIPIHADSTGDCPEGFLSPQPQDCAGLVPELCR